MFTLSSTHTDLLTRDVNAIIDMTYLHLTQLLFLADREIVCRKQQTVSHYTG